jgi:asparagine synthase (glutamine-hydrolysing)
MCGINGFSWDDRQLVRQMNSVISYRGPDDKGTYNDKNISLGHVRLSIIDLSSAGHQPMCNEERNVWLVFNGEIYNFKDIRPELEKRGHQFKSDTDSEAIIHAYEEYGYDCLKHFNGMFSFAIWDERDKLHKKLFLARDRLGVKPLYYNFDGKNIIFSSEIKAILQHEVRREIDLNALNSYLTYRFITSDDTMLSGIKKLLPGHYLVFQKKHSDRNVEGSISIHKYWHLEWNIEDGKSEEYFAAKIDALLNDSVKKRLMSDVPLGAFLSGGLDSSLIVAINAKLRAAMAGGRDDKVKTFSVGFGHASDEFVYAKKVAEYLQTDHKEIVLEYSKMTEALPEIIWYMDEPNSDLTMLPLYFLSKVSRKDAIVVNTGEGADELFSGYHHFKAASPSLGFVPGFVKKNVYKWYYSPFKETERKALFARPGSEMPKEDNSLHEYLNNEGKGHPKHLLNKILLFDIEKELPNWQLTRVDRMTMAHAQEARVPFLDYRMIELAATIPPQLKQKGLNGKYILKKVAGKYLPKEIIYRKKQGFTTPREEWLKKDFQEIAFGLLSRESVRERGLFEYGYIEKLKAKVENSKRDKPFLPYSYKLLMLAMLEQWCRTFVDGSGRKPIKSW